MAFGDTEKKPRCIRVALYGLSLNLRNIEEKQGKSLCYHRGKDSQQLTVCPSVLMRPPRP